MVVSALLAEVWDALGAHTSLKKISASENGEKAVTGLGNKADIDSWFCLGQKNNKAQKDHWITWATMIYITSSN